MAIYRLSVQIISRAKGRSAVAAAAYRAGQALTDETTQRLHDYSRKEHVEHTEILAPKDAPAWATDRERLWNEVESAERRKDAQLAREVQLALPVELSDERQVELVRRFAQERYVDKGMIVDFAIHRPDGQPHAHLMLTMREVGPEGFGNKNREWNADFARNKGNKERFVRGAEGLLDDREAWAHLANEALTAEGHIERIDHRSYETRGLDLAPQPKLGRSWEGLGERTDAATAQRLDAVLETQLANGQRLEADPSIALKALTDNQALFSRDQMLRFIHTHTAEREQFETVRAKVFALPDLVEMGRDSRGREVFSSKAVLQSEQDVLAAGQALAAKEGHRVSGRYVRQAEASRTLSPEQAKALRHVTTATGGLALVEGHAGTGKSYMLGAARDAWEAQGFTVVGAALAGRAAEGLELSAGIPSRSLASWQYQWGEGKKRLSGKHVLVIDEAAMVGTRQMADVLSEANRAGAKVVLVGDTQQLQAIEAGAPMRSLRDEHGAQTLSQIRRQEVDWQRDASTHMAEGLTAKGLDAYVAAGRVHSADGDGEAVQKLVRQWDREQTGLGGSSMMFAYRRDQVQQLNEQARSLRKARGELGAERVITTDRGKRAMAVGERVFFLKNDKELGVSNGTLGTVEAMKGHSITIRTDEDKQVAFDLDDYNHLDHGYAGTVHKGQGATVDRAYVLASSHFDASSSYVALTRHRKSADVYWSKEAFSSEQQLVRSMSQKRPNVAALDQLQRRDRERFVAQVAEKGDARPWAKRDRGKPFLLERTEERRGTTIAWLSHESGQKVARDVTEQRHTLNLLQPNTVVRGRESGLAPAFKLGGLDAGMEDERQGLKQMLQEAKEQKAPAHEIASLQKDLNAADAKRTAAEREAAMVRVLNKANRKAGSVVASRLGKKHDGETLTYRGDISHPGRPRTRLAVFQDSNENKLVADVTFSPDAVKDLSRGDRVQVQNLGRSLRIHPLPQPKVRDSRENERGRDNDRGGWGR